jgi:hypothetical protein
LGGICEEVYWYKMSIDIFGINWYAYKSFTFKIWSKSQGYKWNRNKGC